MNKKEIELPNINGYKLFPEGGRAGWFYVAYIIAKEYTRKDKNVIPLDNVDVLIVGKREIQKWFYYAKNDKKFNKCFNLYIKNSKLLEGLEQKLNNLLTKVKEKEIDFDNLSIKKLNNLVLFYSDFSDRIMRVAAILRHIDRGIIIYLNKKYKERADEFVRNFSISEKLSFALKEEIDFLNLILMVKKENLKIDSIIVNREIDELIKKYWFVGLGYYQEKPRDKKYYQQKIAEFSDDPEEELKSILKNVEDDKNIRNRTIELLDKKERIIAHLAAESAYLKDLYKATINQVIYYFEPVLKEVAVRIKKDMPFVKTMTPEELSFALINNEINEDIIRERFENYIILSKGSKCFVASGKEAEIFEKKYFVESDKNTKQFKGRAASRGCSKGTARVVLGQKDFYKMSKGEILVVINTTPDFVSIMRKASAIVAEEGGLTSHTSVVSREFNIPCIVGVQNITNLIMDGDEVEVDANKGIVKILKKV